MPKIFTRRLLAPIPWVFFTWLIHAQEFAQGPRRQLTFWRTYLLSNAHQHPPTVHCARLPSARSCAATARAWAGFQSDHSGWPISAAPRANVDGIYCITPPAPEPRRLLTLAPPDSLASMHATRAQIDAEYAGSGVFSTATGAGSGCDSVSTSWAPPSAAAWICKAAPPSTPTMTPNATSATFLATHAPGDNDHQEQHHAQKQQIEMKRLITHPPHALEGNRADVGDIAHHGHRTDRPDITDTRSAPAVGSRT